MRTRGNCPLLTESSSSDDDGDDDNKYMNGAMK